MGISRTALISNAKEILEGPLSKVGYSLEENPLEELDEFWFVRQPNFSEGMFHIIEFAPRGFSNQDLFQIDIKLIRRNFHDHVSKPIDFPSLVELGVPLAPNLWQSGGEKFYRWHFVSLADVQDACKDILEKLIEYGIPFLEDPAANNDTWQRWGITAFKKPK